MTLQITAMVSAELFSKPKQGCDCVATHWLSSSLIPLVVPDRISLLRFLLLDQNFSRMFRSLSKIKPVFFLFNLVHFRYCAVFTVFHLRRGTVFTNHLFSKKVFFILLTEWKPSHRDFFEKHSKLDDVVYFMKSSKFQLFTGVFRKSDCGFQIYVKRYDSIFAFFSFPKQ